MRIVQPEYVNFCTNKLIALILHEGYLYLNQLKPRLHIPVGSNARVTKFCIPMAEGVGNMKTRTRKC